MLILSNYETNLILQLVVRRQVDCKLVATNPGTRA